MLALDVLRARHGDCLLLHASERGRTTRVLIDGGPSKTFREALVPRMEALSRSDFGNEPPSIDLAIISHIDADHIGGMLKLLRHNKDQYPNRPLLELKQLWHNSFHSIGGAEIHGAGDEATSAVSTASTAENLFRSLMPSTHTDFGVVMASVGQGNEVSELASFFRIDRMRDFPAGLVTAGTTVERFEPFALHVLGPRQAEIDDLRETWARYMEKLRLKQQDVKEAAVSLDTSVANLSSIVVMAVCAGKRLLLTGDARGDYVLDTLEDGGWISEGVCEVDVFKWPHHGSIRNFPPGLFDRIIARHHVVSANGRHHNPDVETIERFVAAHRPDQATTLHLTYAAGDAHRSSYREHLKHVFEILDSAIAAGHQITVNTPPPPAKWLTLNLA